MAGQTLNDIFPGNRGKLQLVRVSLRFHVVGLLTMDREKPLDAEFAKKLRAYKAEITLG